MTRRRSIFRAPRISETVRIDLFKPGEHGKVTSDPGRGHQCYAGCEHDPGSGHSESGYAANH